MNSHTSINWSGLMAGLCAAAIWGGMYVVSKVVLEIVPPFTLLTIRLVLGTLSLAPFVAAQGGVHFTQKQWLQILGVGIVGYGVSLGFQFVGTKLSTASNGALVTSATPTFVLIFAAWILDEKITSRRLLALGLATLGVITVIDPGKVRLSPNLMWGNLSLVAAGLTWALYSVFIRKVTRGLAVLPVSMICFLGGLPLTIPVAFVELNFITIGPLSGWVVLGIIYLGVISTGMAMFLWNTAFARLDASIASLTFFAQPFFGISLGAILLGEHLTSSFIFGGILIGTGLILAAKN